MADGGLDIMTGGAKYGPGRRRAATPPRKPLGRSIFVLLIVLVVLFVGFKVVGKVMDTFSGPEDYTGQGTGSVVVEIPSGANGQQIANILKKADVVKSAEAFYQLSLNDSRFQAVQAGFFKLRKQMSAEWALRELTDPGNRVEGKVTIPEGARVGQIATIIAKNSDIKEDDLVAALDKPETLGLPDVANLNPEGYLFPATYEVPPGTTATQLLKQMVKKSLDVAKSLDISTRAKALGYTGEEILTIASILEYEAKKDEDYPKVARVLYNRLAKPMQIVLTAAELGDAGLQALLAERTKRFIPDAITLVVGDFPGDCRDGVPPQAMHHAAASHTYNRAAKPHSGKGGGTVRPTTAVLRQVQH